MEDVIEGVGDTEGVFEGVEGAEGEREDVNVAVGEPDGAMQLKKVTEPAAPDVLTAPAPT